MMRFFNRNIIKNIFFGLIIAGVCVGSGRYVYNEYFRKEAKIRALLEERHIDFGKFYNKIGFADPKAYITHGGGVGEFVYTNSYESLMDSVEKGFAFIELDLLITSDGIIVGGHDWRGFKKLLGIVDDTDCPLRYDEIKNRKISGKYSILSGKEIAEIMHEYPDFYLVTDKIQNYKLLLEQIPFPERLVVEVFDYEMYLTALEAGINYPALNVFLSEKHLKKILRYKVPLITGDGSWLFEFPEMKKYYQILHENGVGIFMYGYSSQVQQPYFMKENMGKFFSKFYVDEDYQTIIRQNQQ